ncbi:DNA mismatch repair endonuclease MutH [Glaciecola sp. MH2013]|uniref:DNA mismatch repair endonuclease MutH n=1 Tax=Glaciecola sp. MH2013 TaxID=2785524 RepID=UPI00189ECDCE|nr:DNA mismatch repair endonuclease MutH [Glaciecola sp. MH2013]MBF7073860.1 DNA mismatch repair endonuclease MutH [Glaciecola sp. MH2013]
MSVIKPPQNAPSSIEELMLRATALSGLSLGDLATAAGIKTPANFKTQKGWSGQLIELWLGASAGSKPEQDFPDLGVELKTLPLSHAHQALETTYVCFAPLTNIAGITWETSNVRNKLSCVLWLPIQGEREIPPSERLIGNPILWRASPQEEAQLKQDWEELMDMISLGQVESIDATVGSVMQLRPKAANGSVLTDAVGHDGSIIQTRPRGFYLRKNFTNAILQNSFS